MSSSVSPTSAVECDDHHKEVRLLRGWLIAVSVLAGVASLCCCYWFWFPLPAPLRRRLLEDEEEPDVSPLMREIQSPAPLSRQSLAPIPRHVRL